MSTGRTFSSQARVSRNNSPGRVIDVLYLVLHIGADGVKLASHGAISPKTRT